MGTAINWESRLSRLGGRVVVTSDWRGVLLAFQRRAIMTVPPGADGELKNGEWAVAEMRLVTGMGVGELVRIAQLWTSIFDPDVAAEVAEELPKLLAGLPVAELPAPPVGPGVH